MGGERGELFADRSLPQRLAVAAQRDHRGADAHCVDVAGLRIGGGRRPADAMRRHVTLEDVEAVFPDDLPGIGIEAHHPLLQLRAAAGGVLHADAIANHDRRGSTAVGRAPQEVLALERPFLDQARSRARSRRDSARAARASRPAARAGLPALPPRCRAQQARFPGRKPVSTSEWPSEDREVPWNSSSCSAATGSAYPPGARSHCALSPRIEILA